MLWKTSSQGVPASSAALIVVSGISADAEAAPAIRAAAARDRSRLSKGLSLGKQPD
jgi:hypothetical protein